MRPALREGDQTGKESTSHPIQQPGNRSPNRYESPGNSRRIQREQTSRLIRGYPGDQGPLRPDLDSHEKELSS